MASLEVKVDRIIRAKELHGLTGINRSSIWRYEKKGQFPKRVALGAKSVGSLLSR